MILIVLKCLDVAYCITIHSVFRNIYYVLFGSLGEKIPYSLNVSMVNDYIIDFELSWSSCDSYWSNINLHICVCPNMSFKHLGDKQPPMKMYGISFEKCRSLNTSLIYFSYSTVCLLIDWSRGSAIADKTIYQLCIELFSYIQYSSRAWHKQGILAYKQMQFNCNMLIALYRESFFVYNTI